CYAVSSTCSTLLAFLCDVIFASYSLWLVQRLPCSPLFPYTTLFRSRLPCSTTRCTPTAARCRTPRPRMPGTSPAYVAGVFDIERSEEHTSELQSRVDLVCRLLLEKKKDKH